jgi:ribosomal protein L3 glutamine methyltransferase
MNVLELIERSSARLEKAGVSFGHGTTNAFDEAAWLVLWRLGLPLDALDEVAEQALIAQQCAAVEALVDQRIATRQPAAYLTGEAWLQGVPFFVDERTIVPRSLIAEVLCEGTLDVWLDPRYEAGLEAGAGTGTDEARAPQVLDLCTGNGSLAVLAALCWPQAQVEGTDLSAEALAVAQRNVQRHALEARVTLRQGDGLAAARGPYDLILCNPPYVNRDSMQSLPAEYRAEPALALDGGPDGMDFIRPMLAQAAARLGPGGVLVLEIGHERAHFEAAFSTLSPLWLSTSAGDDQVLLLTREDLAS